MFKNIKVTDINRPGIVTHNPQKKIENLALSGRLLGKRARGSQRYTFTKNFKKIFKHRTELWETA